MNETRSHTGQDSIKTKGHCLCGAVKFTVSGELRDILICHCAQCLHWHGQAAWYSQASRDAIQLESDKALRWYRSSRHARRGFCGDCGSSLFWSPGDGSRWSIAAGALQGADYLKTEAHIFCAHRPGWDRSFKDVPCYPGNLDENPVSN